MSKQYTPEEKAAALEALAATKNVATASLVAGVPQRTLYRWQRQQRLEGKLPPLPQENSALPPPLPRHPDDPDAEDLRADGIMDEVLNHLMEQARLLSLRFSQNYDQMPPVSQMMALTRLIDRIIKLDARKPRTGKELRVRVIRVDKGEREPDGW
jgi:transposase-like protein